MDVSLTACDAVRTTAVGARILDAASRLFYEHGINATGVDQIVEEAGTTKRTLYQRFGSKDALVAAYLQHRAHDWQTQLLDSLNDPTPSEGVIAIYRQARRWITESSRGCAFVNAWAELHPSNPSGAAIVQNEKRWMLDLFTQLAQGDPRLGVTLHLLYEGAQLTAAVSQNPVVFFTAQDTSCALLAHKIEMTRLVP